MKTMLRLLLGSFTLLCLQAAMPIPAAGADATTTADSAKPDLSSLKYGLAIHFGTATFADPGEQGTIPAERFAPTALDVKSWVHAAKEAGMTFAMLIVKHESGFCLWNSADYDYDIAHSPVKTDIIGDFIAACNAEGIVPGVQYSIPDAYNEGVIRRKGPVPPPYFSVIKRHVTELHTMYPGIRVQIFDDDGLRLTPAQYHELCQIIQQLNPQCVILNHNYEPRHVSATVIKSWMWRPNAQLNTADQLIQRYNQSQMTGRSFTLSVGPDSTGTIPASQIAVLMDMKNLIANPPPAGSPAPADNSAKPDAAERLKQLKSLYDQGLINKDDYDKKVKEVMDSL
jgi:hypothetical protein